MPPSPRPADPADPAAAGPTETPRSATVRPATVRPATVRLVGAGPGDAGLLTLRGRDALAAADLVLADALVSPDVLAFAGDGAEVVVRSHAPTDAPGTREADQRALIARMIAEARGGRSVCRLKGGDPSVFGRSAEEADALLAAGVPVEVVPGVTAASAAAALAGVPLTHRDHAGAVCFVTGHEAGRRGGGLDFASLAAFPGTRVFYMARRRLGRIAAGLVDAGLPPDTPAAVVSHAARVTQRTVAATISTVAAAADAAGLPGPAVLFVGPAAVNPGPRAWWERRPLAGARAALVGTDAADDSGRRRGAGTGRGAGPGPAPVDRPAGVVGRRGRRARRGAGGRLARLHLPRTGCGACWTGCGRRGGTRGGWAG